jgi:APA family basic amino acid/polyamine antiporter
MEQKKYFTLPDAILLIVSSMIGSAIWVVTPDMLRSVGGPGYMLLLWVAAGMMTLLCAVSYGELSAMFPKAGGQYTYLKEAFGKPVAFLYGWTLFSVIQTGTIAAVGVAFAKFMGVLFPAFSETNYLFTLGYFNLTAAQVLGICSIVALTIINSRYSQLSKNILRYFTSTKIIAIFSIIILGLIFFSNKHVWELNLSHFWDKATYSVKDGNVSILPLEGMTFISVFGVAMVGSLFSMDAWNNITFIGDKLKNPKRNLPRSLFIGTLVVTLIYLFVNFAFLHLIPFAGNPNGVNAFEKGIMFAEKERVGIAAASQIFENHAAVVMAILIIISAIGCNNGLILSGARVYQQMALDGLFFSSLKTNNSKGEPEKALWLQCFWASILCLSGKYGDLLDYVIFAVVIFYILTVIGLFVLRIKAPQIERPYKAVGYPILPAIYILMAVFFCINILINKPQFTFPGLIIVLIGIPVYYFWNNGRDQN